MPRRTERDPFALRLGQRLRALRRERQLSIQQMVWSIELPGRHYLMEVENGRSIPSTPILARIAAFLEVLLADLVCFPGQSPRERLIEFTRHLSLETIERLLEQAERLRDEDAPSS